MSTNARQCRLTEFDADGLPTPPVVILDVNAEPVRAPTGDGTVAGHIGAVKHRGGRAYVSRKVRSKHHYWTGGGYALSVKILHYLMRQGVHHLIWYETENNRTLEYGISQYVEDGEPVRYAPKDDPQVCVPDDDARHFWLDHTPVLDARSQ